MALVIASTTDSQEQVNQAAGITTPQPPSEAPERESRKRRRNQSLRKQTPIRMKNRTIPKIPTSRNAGGERRSGSAG